MDQRYYDPQIGRFLSSDPMQVDTTSAWNFNRYNYANNSPYKFTDPDGRGAVCDSTPGGCGMRPLTAAESQRREEAYASAGGAILDNTPIIGDAKGIVEVSRNPSLIGAASVLVGLLPGGDSTAGAMRTSSNIAENAAKGARAENAVAAALGDQVAGRRVTLEATTGQRSVADIVTTSRGVTEVKSGNARLSPGQKAVKADIEAGRPVTPRGQNAADTGLTPGQPTQMTCYDVTRCQ